MIIIKIIIIIIIMIIIMIIIIMIIIIIIIITIIHDFALPTTCTKTYLRSAGIHLICLVKLRAMTDRSISIYSVVDFVSFNTYLGLSFRLACICFCISLIYSTLILFP